MGWCKLTKFAYILEGDVCYAKRRIYQFRRYQAALHRLERHQEADGATRRTQRRCKHLPQSCAETPNRFRVVGLTRRGHGRSARPDSGYAFDTLVKDIHYFLDALGLDRTILVGHSFAGLEIPFFTIQYLHCVEEIVYLDALFPKLDPEPDLSDNPVWSLHPKRPTDDNLASRKAFLVYYKRARPDLARI